MRREVYISVSDLFPQREHLFFPLKVAPNEIGGIYFWIRVISPDSIPVPLTLYGN